MSKITGPPFSVNVIHGTRTPDAVEQKKLRIQVHTPPQDFRLDFSNEVDKVCIIAEIRQTAGFGILSGLGSVSGIAQMIMLKLFFVSLVQLDTNSVKSD